jgi:hypothetical protein
MTKTKHSPGIQNSLPTLDPGGGGPPALNVDWEEFAHFLDETGWSDEEKADYLQTLWGVMVEFAMLGFGFHPVQQAGSARTGEQNTCGKLPEDAAPRPDTGADAVNLMDQFKSRNTGRAAATEDGAV